MKRLLTAAIGVPLALLAVFRLESLGFFLVCGVAVGWAAVELVAIARAWAPGAPLGVLPVLALGLAAFLALPQVPHDIAPLAFMLVGVALTVGLGTLVLLARTPPGEVPAALGTLGYGTLYLALPLASVVHLQRQDPWLVFLLVTIVWLGDTAAYYVGSAWGRHRMAPVVSPKKTWEGAVAGLAIGLVSTVVWSYLRLGRFELAVLAAGLATAIAAQLGDLVESLFKRASGIKDSGRVLPGHGGLLDRADALLFAGPVLWLSWLAAQSAFDVR